MPAFRLRVLRTKRFRPISEAETMALVERLEKKHLLFLIGKINQNPFPTVGALYYFDIAAGCQYATGVFSQENHDAGATFV